MIAARTRMIDEQLVRRNIGDPRVLDAFRSVPREAFVPERLAELAYEDGPLPIGDGQTISQPYVVALTIEALGLRGGERVLEIGTGTGYSAALLGRIAAEVQTVERLPTLGAEAAGRLATLGYENVHVTIADGSLGLREHAPYDAIAVAAAGPAVPAALREQLAVGGRLVMPVAQDGGQALVRVTRRSEDVFTEERLLDVTFVPLVGAQAWPTARADDNNKKKAESAGDPTPIVRKHAEPLDLARVVRRIGDARVVLLGGAIDGSLELARLRVRLTRELLASGSFAFVAVEGDWNDGARIDEHVRRLPERTDLPYHAFARYPSFRFRNREVAAFVDELRARGGAVAFRGLDVYGTTAAVSLALERVSERDPEHAREAAARCTTISPWRRGVADLLVEEAELEPPLVRTLVTSLRDRVEGIRSEGSRAFEAARRAAEDGALYYRHLLRGSLDAWSIRTDAMANMLRALLEDHGEGARAIVWAHDTQVADAAGAETGVRGHRTLGQLARLGMGDAYLVGIDAGRGTILASPSWGSPPEPMRLRAPHEESLERALEATGLPALALPLSIPELRGALRTPRLSRAIGPVYRPDRELVTHYLGVSPSLAFDEILFVSETTPLESVSAPPTCEPEQAHPLA